ncbi:membrane dipeptidase [Microbacterium paludicola]|uniref:Membrane dipeptidase n=1 Tax=Microbacterium paludicola TaxID=300019 RepID=A0A4Y9FW50_9MICO|nr:dipeptidase [Microbacterium paludicola]MBF0816580.1 dipeptidase [Microbacterium paludicola]TFU32770.1 membrane dipeptidase [Microbacterium paludicola]
MSFPAAATSSSVVREVLADFPIFDGHNDLPYAAGVQYGLSVEATRIDQGNPRLHTDIPSLRAGGVGAQFWSVYTDSTLPEAEATCQLLEQIDFVYRLVKTYPDTFRLARTAADIRAAWAEGKVASLMGAEGGHAIRESLGVLRMLRRLGVGYLTLTHNDNTAWAASATGEPVEYGLTDHGRAIVAEMNRIGMLVDISHVAPSTMRDAIDASSRPVIFSHSSCRGVADHVRNAPDDVLTSLAGNGGVIMITFVPSFVNEAAAEHVRIARAKREELGLDTAIAQPGRPAPEPDPAAVAAFDAWAAAHPAPVVGIGDVVTHVEHAREVAGIDHIGIGSDFDGVPAGPEGLRRVSDYPRLLEALEDRGWSANDLKKLTSGNILRVIEETEVESW